MTLRDVLSKVKNSEVEIVIKGACFNCKISMEDGWHDTGVLSETVLNKEVSEISTTLHWNTTSEGEEYIAGSFFENRNNKGELNSSLRAYENYSWAL